MIYRSKRKFPIPFWAILLILLTALVTFIPSFSGFIQSKKDLIAIWQEQGQLLSENILRTGRKILAMDEQAVRYDQQRLLEKARYIQQLDSLYSNKRRLVVTSVRKEFKQDPLFIKNLNKLKSIRFKGRSQRRRLWHNIETYLTQGKLNESITIIHTPFDQSHSAEAVVIRRRAQKGFIVIPLIPMRSYGLRQKHGLQEWLNQISRSSSISYIIIRKGGQVLAKTQNSPAPDSLQHFEGQPWQIIEARPHQIFQFNKYAPPDLILTIGFSTRALANLQKSLVKRLLINSVIFLILGSIFIIYFFKKQNYSLLNSEFRRMETYTASILEKMNEGIIVLNSQRELAIINRAALNLLQIEEKNLRNRPLNSLKGNLPKALFKKFTQFSTIHEHEISVEHNNQSKHILLSARLIESNRVEEMLYLILLRDNTLQKELEGVRARKSKLVAMGELASRVAHEIRNPLNGISVIIQRLQREFVPGEKKDTYLEMTGLIRTENSRINQIIESFLKYAKNPKLNLQSSSIKGIVEQLKPVFEIEGKAEVRYNLQNTEEIPLDRDQFKQVVINLIQNAQDFSPPVESVDIKLLQNEKSIQLIIQDRGSGIDPAIKDNIFDLYFTTKDSGHGLGLSIVEKIVSAHGGRVYVESPVAKAQGTKAACGARFIVEFTVN